MKFSSCLRGSTVFTLRVSSVDHFIPLCLACTKSYIFTEMKESHLYRNYSPGEISTRLYIKNLAKQVEEKVHCITGYT